MKKLLTTGLLTIFVSACSGATSQPNNTESNLAKIPASDQDIAFIAFGDGGYHVNYPKQKHLDNPKTKAEFIAAEKADWLEDFRPMSEFDHAPIYVYPNTTIATEKGGALAVGKAMASVCQQRACDFAIQLGDNIYPDGADANDGKDDQQRMNNLILTPLLPLLDVNPALVVYSALGNHDWKSSRKGVALQTQWMAQQPNFFMDKQGYYSYVQGEPGNDIEFFVLDTNMLLAGQTYYEVPLNPDGSEGDLATALANNSAILEDIEVHETPIDNEDIKQLNWLKNGLEQSKAKWKMVYGHHILWSIGGTKYSEGHVLRKLLMPTLCRYADAYIAGHEHDLEMLTDDCSLYPEVKSHAPLPLIISGAASKMRGKHSPFAEHQEKTYPQYELLWSESFVWGFAHLETDHKNNQFSVEFFTTPTNESGEAVSRAQFHFKHRSH